MRVVRGKRRLMPRRIATIALIACFLPLTHAVSLRTTAEGSASPETAHRQQLLAASTPPFNSWVYQLQGYGRARLHAIATSGHDLAVVDLARDASTDWFKRSEVREVQRSGTRVLAYFEIGSIEKFRPEFPLLQRQAPKLVLNRWDEWPEEFFVKYWTRRWWRLVVRPRLDRAIRVGYDGVYLDTPLAYEEIPLSLAGGRDRRELAQEMVNLIGRIDRYSARAGADLWVVPQNSPELRRYRGYTGAVDGLGVEELFYRATDRPCTARWCAENLAHVQRLRDEGKFVLAVDYAADPQIVESACVKYAMEGLTGYVTDVALDRIRPGCPRDGSAPASLGIVRHGGGVAPPRSVATTVPSPDAHSKH